MKTPRNLKLIKATYLKDYIYRFEYSNGKTFDTNFKPMAKRFCRGEYLDITKFRKMKYEKDGFIYWGKNWDLCFSIDHYYGERTLKPAPMKTIIADFKKSGLHKRVSSKLLKIPKH